MKKNEINVGGLYLAKVSGVITTVRVDAIRETNGYKGESVTRYDVTNLRTGRHTTFRSAAKFRGKTEDPRNKYPTPDIEELAGQLCPDDRIDRSEQPKETAQRPTTPASESVRSMASSDVTTATGTAQSAEGPTDHRGPHDDGEARELVPEAFVRTVVVCPECGFRFPGRLGEEAQCPNCDTSGIDTIPLRKCSKCGRLLGDRQQYDICELCTPPPRAEPEGEQCSDPTTADGASQQVAGTVTMADVPKVAAQTINNLGLASKIATARAGRQRGTPVAGMVPNDEQESVLEACADPGLRVLVIGAGAGTGKTATLKMLEQVLPGRGQYTAFNASLVAESKAKFQKAACNTTHSLAFRAVGKLYQHRLNGGTVKSAEVAQVLGITNLTVAVRGAGEPDTDGKPTDKLKTLRADFLAGQVIAAIRRFCQSADHEIGAKHVHYVGGIEAPADGGKLEHTNNDLVKEYLLPFCRKAWEDLSRVDGQLPFSHDHYVKIWQLGQGNDRPVIAADYILLDEAQDTAPVFLDVLRQQTHALLVFVGDSNQQIYEWRGAVDAMKAYPDAERRLLSQSYRFGQAIADVANAVLATLEEPTDLVMRGMPGTPSRVAEVAEPRCYLYRTNAGAISMVMQAVAGGKRPHLAGKADDTISWCQAAVDLQDRRGTRHLELACFNTWAEVQDYGKTDEGADLRLMVRLVDRFGAREICNALKNMPKEEDADLVISTAHKSKGREWDTVRLGPDFPTANRMTDADRRLLYVAATRAKLTLDVSECPPFCGGYDARDTCNPESGAWVPGLTVTYTQPMPSEADQAAWLAARESIPTSTGLGSAGLPTREDYGKLGTADPSNRPASSGVTYTKLRSGNWGIRATTKVKEGQTVTVTTRAGVKKQEKVGKIVWSGNGIWLAALAE